MKPFSYCINALCSERVNEGYSATCLSCGSSLLINERFRLIDILQPNLRSKRIKTYRAIDIETNDQVIIKIDEMRSTDVVNFLKREHDVLQCFPEKFFPRQITIQDYFEWRPVPEIEGLVVSGLILPEIEGMNSQDWIKKNGPISQDKAIKWILQVIPYLQHLNDIAFLHRDIKPSNIMVGPGEKLTLIDYGTCREMDTEYMSIVSAKVVSDDDIYRYREITRVFSSGYTSPEQNEGKPLPQSDYYSLGRTVVYWISGRNPSDLTSLTTNRIDWSKTSLHDKCEQCFLNYLGQLISPDPRKRPLRVEDIQVFLTTHLPIQIQAERRINSSWFKLVKLVSFGLGVLGVIFLSLFAITRILNAFGNQALVNEDPERAAQYFNMALKLDPNYRDAIHNLGVACQKINDFDCAQSSLEKAIKLDPNSSYSTYQLGVLLEKTANQDQAAKLYAKAIALNPNNGEALNRSARLKILENKYEEAESMLADASNLNPDKQLKAEILRNQGWIDLRKNQYTKSIQKLSKSIELDPRFSDSFCLLAKNYEARGDFNIAKGYWSACLELPEFRTEVYRWRNEILDRAFSDEKRIN